MSEKHKIWDLHVRRDSTERLEFQEPVSYEEAKECLLEQVSIFDDNDFEEVSREEVDVQVLGSDQTMTK